MTRKLILLSAAVALVAIVGQALSQGPDSKGQGSSPSDKASPAVSPAPQKTESAKSESKVPTAKETPSKATKESSSKTFPTSSSSTAVPARRQITIDKALVTIKDDNKVPASEAGMLTAINVKEGKSVEENELLAEIDTRSTIAKRRIAEGELHAALAQAANEAELDVAIKAEEVAKASLEQIDDVRRKSPGAVSEFERRKTYFEHEKAKAQIKQATNEKEIARLTSTAKQAQYDAASIELDLRQVKAPFKGQVVEVLKNKGDWVTVGEPILHIVGLDKLRVKGFVHTSEASHDQVSGQPVTITVHAAGGKEHTVKGVISFASPVISGMSAARSFAVIVEVDNEKRTDPVTGQEVWKIEPGSSATMVIDLTQKPAAKVNSFKPVTSDSKKRER